MVALDRVSHDEREHGEIPMTLSRRTFQRGA